MLESPALFPVAAEINSCSQLSATTYETPSSKSAAEPPMHTFVRNNNSFNHCPWRGFVHTDN
jgi:hypothetical protein